MENKDKRVVKTDNIGFCFGVRKSLELIEHILMENKYSQVYMLGEIIHNDLVIDELKSKGIKIIKSFGNIPDIPSNAVVVIQSHGVGPDIYKKLEDRKINYIDSTCRLVKRIHSALKGLENSGYYPVIIGNKNHTEVVGISGYARKEPIIIERPEEVIGDLFKGVEKVGVVIQSTFIKEMSDEVIEKIRSFVDDIKVVDTICTPTKMRQEEVRKKSKVFKSIVVIGCRSSSNTNKLYSISKKNNKNTFFIEKPEDVERYDFRKLTPVLVTSGASSPDWLIDEVYNKIKRATNEFYAFSSKYLPKIDEEMDRIIAKKAFELMNKLKDPVVSKIMEIIKEHCLRSGKRLRPLLLLLSYLGYGGSSKRFSEIFRVSSAVELMHNFLLIHDDIIDEAEERRSGPSFHLHVLREFGNLTYNKNVGRDMAIVAGDILFSISIGIIADTKLPLKKKNLFIKHFSECYELTGWGQIFDVMNTKIKDKKNIDTEYAKKTNLLKTSYYTIYYPLLFGFIISNKIVDENLFEKERSRIEDVSIPLGLGFQIRDDILGVFGDPRKIGKSNVSDIKEAKVTSIIGFTLENLYGDELEFFKNLLTKQDKTEDDIAKIKDLIKKSGGLERSKRSMENYLKEAEEKIKFLGMMNEFKRVLSGLIEILSEDLS